ncbi:NFACT family protein [Candidatus Woesearchaeota archaeon]|nr:NFACT family protein [Candidatus Woesearchaeota archaeon]
MAKQISSIDLHFLIKELKDLEKSKVDRIYNVENEEMYMQFHKSNAGKKILRIMLGKGIFISEEKSSDEKPSHFCTMMRKHLEGKILESIEQIKPERIIKFALKSKEEEKILYVEIFGKGNVILCNKDGIIIEALLKQKFRERSILPKEKYKHPIMQYNVFDLGKDNIRNLLKSSQKDKMVTLLATELGLGGVYSEETCLLGNIDKNASPGKITEKEISAISDSIKKIINKKTSPGIIYDDHGAVDVIPADFEFYRGHEKKEFPSFNSALEHYFTREAKILEKKKDPYEKQINELRRIIEEQESTLKGLAEKEDDCRKKAELIYGNYKLISEILAEINRAKEKHSWEEIKKRLKGHKIVKDIDVKEKMVVVEV